VKLIFHRSIFLLKKLHGDSYPAVVIHEGTALLKTEGQGLTAEIPQIKRGSAVLPLNRLQVIRQEY
jgi:hypothetical protein